MDLTNVSNIEEISTVFNPKKGIIPDTNYIACNKDLSKPEGIVNQHPDIVDKSKLKSSNLETSHTMNSVKSHIMLEKECYVYIERIPLEFIKLHSSSVKNLQITKEYQKPAEIIVDKTTPVNGFIGFSMEECQKSVQHKFTIQNLELEIKLLNNNHNHN